MTSTPNPRDPNESAPDVRHAPDPCAHKPQIPDPRLETGLDAGRGRLVARGKGHLTAYAWPVDCPLQAGTNGAVFDKSHPDGAYNTCFFEAFPRNPSTFLRGEGATVADAETAAWQQWQRINACPAVQTNGEHRFEARGYRNGGGICADCGLFSSHVFTGEDLGQFCAVCGTATTYTWREDVFYCRTHRPPSRFARMLAEAAERDGATQAGDPSAE